MRILKLCKAEFGVLSQALAYVVNNNDSATSAPYLAVFDKVKEKYECLGKANLYGRKLEFRMTQDEYELCKKAAYAHHNFYTQEKPHLQDLTATMITKLYNSKYKNVIER